MSDSLWKRIKKVLRFILIYGPGLTWFKIAGRTRSARIPRLGVHGSQRVCVIGCGQFAFATIGYYLSRQRDARIASCFDTDAEAAKSFAYFHRVPKCAENATDAISDSAVEIVYIASNHRSHAEYAVQSLELGRSVYIEKPIAVNSEQLKLLSQRVRETSGKIYAGYNRPFSGAIRALKRSVDRTDTPMTYSCFVSGHQIPADHWYRLPDEGTRVCGNIGHWLDLLVHLASWGELPNRWNISLTWSDEDARDDDLAINLVSERGDLANIVLTSRSEPFDGIGESINLQWGNCIARIEDFRRMTVWKGAQKSVRRYWPKDAGHRRAILQPFNSVSREWHEVESSTMLTLAIADMVRRGDNQMCFSFIDARGALNSDIG